MDAFFYRADLNPLGSGCFFHPAGFWAAKRKPTSKGFWLSGSLSGIFAQGPGGVQGRREGAGGHHDSLPRCVSPPTILRWFERAVRLLTALSNGFVQRQQVCAPRKAPLLWISAGLARDVAFVGTLSILHAKMPMAKGIACNERHCARECLCHIPTWRAPNTHPGTRTHRHAPPH